MNTDSKISSKNRQGALKISENETRKPSKDQGTQGMTRIMKSESTNSHHNVIHVQNLTLGYGRRTLLRDLNFSIARGEIFAIIGKSGCGKTTLLKSLIGLQPTPGNTVFYNGTDLCKIRGLAEFQSRLGVLYQGGALWSSMTVGENVALPIERYRKFYRPWEIRELVQLKLALVGLEGAEELYPWEISGGMVKRAGIARAIALDPDILFLDEPSAGLDPLTARHLDKLILELRETLGTTIILVTHELGTIFSITDRILFLDTESQTALAIGRPEDLAGPSSPQQIRLFLNSLKCEKVGSTEEKKLQSEEQQTILYCREGHL